MIVSCCPLCCRTLITTRNTFMINYFYYIQKHLKDCLNKQRVVSWQYTFISLGSKTIWRKRRKNIVFGGTVFGTSKVFPCGLYLKNLIDHSLQTRRACFQKKTNT